MAFLRRSLGELASVSLRGAGESTREITSHSHVSNFHSRRGSLTDARKLRWLRDLESAFTLSRVKVSPLHCACLFVICAQLVACGDAAEPLAPPTSAMSGGPTAPEDAKAETPEAAEVGAQPDCADLSQEQIRCGQLSLDMKGAGSSCQLTPTANDLTRPPRSVLFDCQPLERGSNGYDFDALGHITLMGDTCEALQKSGPHRVTLLLGCPPS